MKNSVAVIIVLLAMIQVVHAVDLLSFENCEKLGMECPEDWNLSIDQQKDFVITMLSEKEPQPKHNFIRTWNTELDITDPPIDITPVSQGSILNAWLIPDMLPSVKDKNTYYINNKGLFHTIYGFEFYKLVDFVRNEEYESTCGMGPTNPGMFGHGDCRTLYTNEQKSANMYYSIGDSDLGGISISEENHHSALNYNMDIKPQKADSTMRISHSFDMERWRWQRGSCCKKSKWGCSAVFYICNPFREEPKSFTLSLKNETQVSARDPQFSFNKLLFEQNGVGYLNMVYDDIEQYYLDLGEVSFKKRLHSYNTTYSALPYNLLTIEVKEDPKFVIENAKILEDDGTRVKFDTYAELEDCQLWYSDYFNEKEVECDYVVLPPTTIKMKPDRYNYKDGDTINLKVKFESEGTLVEGDIKLTYADEEKIVHVEGSTDVSFTVDPNYNVIKAEFETDKKLSSSYNIITISFDELIKGKDVIFAISILVPLGIIWYVIRRKMLNV